MTKKAGKKTATKKAGKKTAPKRTGITSGPVFLHEVPVVLTEAERIKRGEAMTKMMGEKESMLGRFDLERKEHNARVKEKEAEIDQHRRAFERKTENRRIKCRWKHDWKKGEKLLIRTDLTGKESIVLRATITAEERQLDLDKVAAKNKAATQKAEAKKKAEEEAAKKGAGQPLTATLAERAAVAEEAGKDPKKDPPKKPSETPADEDAEPAEVKG